MFNCLQIFNKPKQKEYVAHQWKLHHSLTRIRQFRLCKLSQTLDMGGKDMFMSALLSVDMTSIHALYADPYL